MRRAATIAFAAIAIVAVVALAAEAATDDRDLAFTLGVIPGQVAAKLGPGEEACQRPVVVEEAFSAIRLKVGSPRNSYGPLNVTVREAAGGQRLARGQLGGRFAVSGAQRPVRLDGEVPKDRVVAVCVGNAGRGKLTVYGGPAFARVGTAVELGGRRRPTDMTLVFERAHARSVLSLLPDVFRHASLFHPGLVGAWTFWLLLALVLGAVPALLVAALRSATDPDGSPPTR